LSLGTLNL